MHRWIAGYDRSMLDADIPALIVSHQATSFADDQRSGRHIPR
jgi:hypothetical protein